MRISPTRFIAITFSLCTHSVSAQLIEWDRAWALREQVGLAPMDIAAMNVPGAFHESLIAAVREHFGTEAETDGPLVDAVVEAERDVSMRISWGRDPADARRDLEDTRMMVIDVLAALIDDSQDRLPPNLQGYVDRAVANGGLDSPYRLLNLLPAQREALLALQHPRDRVLRDARQRVRPGRVEAAREAFGSQAQLVLTRAQQAELAQLQSNIAANLEAVLDREMADYPEDSNTENPEETESGGQAKALPQRQNNSMAAVLAE